MIEVNDFDNFNGSDMTPGNFVDNQDLNDYYALKHFGKTQHDYDQDIDKRQLNRKDPDFALDDFTNVDSIWHKLFELL